MRLLLGDCRELLRQLPDNSVDAVVTDPPYELGFMGKKWDGTGIAYEIPMWREVLRVLKPGGHLLSCGGARTYHRMACAVEDAGFEIRDCIQWLYGTGFPKSLNISKAIDAAAGVEREVVGLPITAPATDAAKQWEGWGTALKPAYEPIIVARKPLDGTVAANVLKHGVGGLNIDGCRIETMENLNGGAYAKDPTPRAGQDLWSKQRKGDVNVMKRGGAGEYVQPTGRWPANVVLDEDAAAQLDVQSGVSKSTGGKGEHSGLIDNPSIYGKFSGKNKGSTAGGLGDSGGASRFFYCAKASRSEREAGCESLPAKTPGEMTGGREEGSDGLNSPRAGAGRTSGARNDHPTVKPVALMRWLVRLVTPPGGTVADPFMGSGTTGVACAQEGFAFIGMELDEGSYRIAQARVHHAAGTPLPPPGKTLLEVFAAEEAVEVTGPSDPFASFITGLSE